MRRMTCIALAAAGALTATATTAGAQEGPWRLRIGPAAVESSHDILLDASLGFGADLEYWLSPRFGVDVGVLTANVRDEPDLDFFGIDVDTEVRVTPVVARLNLHLTPDSRVDLHIAPVAAWVKIGDGTMRVRDNLFGNGEEESVRVPIDDELTWGASLGFDVPLGRSSYLTFEATYLSLDFTVRDPQVRDPEEVVFPGDLDPVFVHIGYGVRF